MQGIAGSNTSNTSIPFRSSAARFLSFPFYGVVLSRVCQPNQAVTTLAKSALSAPVEADMSCLPRLHSDLFIMVSVHMIQDENEQVVILLWTAGRALRS